MQSIIGNAALRSAFSVLEPYPSAALAVSGGPDSVALMHLASRWLSLTGRSQASVTVLTVDHGLRPESANEAAFVAREAQRLGLTQTTLAWIGEKPKTGIQAAARRARYDLMAGYCLTQGIACLATAHTADDQAETFLMRLGRGSGLDGLAAMAAVSGRDGVPLVRPLLVLSKARILAYLRACALPFVSDPSNENLAFERVRLRQAMKAFAAAGITKSALALSASRLGRSREALSQIASEFLERNFSVTRLGQGTIGLADFHMLPAEIALRVLSRALALIGGKDEAPRMAKVERLLGDLKGGKREAALGGCLVIAAPEALSVYREPGRLGRAALIAQPGGTCIWDGRFALTFAAGLSGEALVTPLGEAGWAICRKVQKERGSCLQANHLAAVTTPAVWREGFLISAPALNYSGAGAEGEPLVNLRLVPRLCHFLKPI